MNQILAAAILARWEDEVRRFAPDEHLRWQRLLQILPPNLPPAQLRDALSPIAVKNDKEQARFRELFDQVLLEIRDLQDGAEPPPPPPPPVPTPARWLRRILLLDALALAATAAYLFYQFRQEQARQSAALPDKVSLYAQVGAGAEAALCPDSVLLQRLGGVLDAAFDSEAPGNTERTRRAALGEATLSAGGCLRYAALPDTAGADTVRYRLRTARKAQVLVEAVVEVARPVAVVPGRPQVQYRFFVQPSPHDHDPLLRDMRFEESDALARFLHRWAWLIRLGLLAAAAALTAWWVLWRARKRQKLVARRDKSARPPYVWPIRIPDLAPPEPGDAFGPALNALRRRAADEHRLLDLPATVRATIRGGGLARFRFRRQTRPPEYLLLVDRADPRDHRARFYDDLYRLLLQNEVLVVRFFFDGDARLCHNDEHPHGLGLDELLFRYPHHRLLVIGDGRRWFSAATGRLAPWTELLDRWPQRALLSTLPAADWGRRERALSARFRFAPATVAGLRTVVELFESDDADARLPDPSRLAGLAMPAPVTLSDEGDLLHALDTQLPDPDTRTWLAACALWPELHYDLTLWLGARLEQDTGRPLLSFARLADLLRLPWFSTGEMPDPARAALIDRLRATHPGLENRLREALYALLEQHGPPTDSVAWDDYALHLAFNRWLTATDPKTQKALEDQIARWIDEHGEPDFITVRELRGQPGLLDQLLPDAWKKRLFKGRLPALGLRDVWRDGLRAALAVAALAAGLYAFWRPQAPDACAGERAELLLDTGETLSVCADTDAERALLREYRLRRAAAEADTARFDSLLRAPGPALDPESRANVSNAAYNAGVPAYQAADSLRQTQAGYRADTSGQQQYACLWFAKAAAADTTLAYVRRAAAWCAQPDAAAKIDIRAAINGRVLDAATGAPLGGVRVQGPRTDLRTGPDGRYTLRLPPDFPSPQIALRFSAQGYREQTRTFAVEATDTLPALLLVGIPPPNPVGQTGNTEPTPAETTATRPPVVTVPEPGTAEPTPGATTTQPDPTALPLPDPIRRLEADMVPVTGGTFTMGCRDEQRDGDCYDREKPAHRVTVGNYAVGRYEVTQAQWRAVMGSDPPELNNTGCDQCPVERVSWNDIQEFLQKLNARTGKTYRLPTEAEWEYAARGGNKSNNFLYSGSNNINEVAWYDENYKKDNTFGAQKTTRPVGTKKANELGLYDMSGNVWEWCADWYGDYPSGPVNNPTGPAEGSLRVLRGGGWLYFADYCRVADRFFNTPEDRNLSHGFRVARSPQ